MLEKINIWTGKEIFPVEFNHLESYYTKRHKGYLCVILFNLVKLCGTTTTRRARSLRLQDRDCVP